MSIREDLKAYLDGELTPERARDVENALASDSELQKELEQMRILGFEIRAVAPELRSEGKEHARQLVTRPARAWWHPYSPVGRYALSGACLILLAFSLFPIFAQSKNAAMTMSVGQETKERSTAKMDYSDTSASPSTESPDLNGAGAGAPAHDQGVTSTRELNGKVGFQGATGDLQDPSVQAPAYGSTLDGAAGADAELKYEAPKRPSESADRAKAQRAQTAPPISVEKQRMVVKDATMGLLVENVVDAKTAVESIAMSMGGYVEGGNVNSYPGSLPSANLTIRVKASMFEQAMNQLRKLGEVTSESQNGEDVTAQYADTDARIKVLKAEEDSYITMLRAAKKTGEMLEIKERLSQVRQEIESLDATMRSLKDLSTLSTIQVRLEQKPKIGETDKTKEKPDDTWTNAVNGLLSALLFLRNAAIYIFVYAPIWLPPVILFWWLGKKAKKA